MRSRRHQRKVQQNDEGGGKEAGELTDCFCELESAVAGLDARRRVVVEKARNEERAARRLVGVNMVGVLKKLRRRAEGGEMKEGRRGGKREPEGPVILQF